MKIIYCEKLPRIIKNRKILEKELNVRITNKGKNVFIDGKTVDEYIGEKIIDALNFGFPFGDAMLIKKQDFVFEILNIKDYTKRHDFEIIKARIIGRNGKTLKTLAQLTECYFELKDNYVGIIGAPENIKNAQQAIISLIRGSKQSNVYKLLEKRQLKAIEDLGLKEKF